MPLLRKKQFVPEPVPEDLKPTEKVFLCQPTQEVFRDYEQFFNRMFQCNSHIWTCELTGTSGLTYSQAAKSEKEAWEIITKRLDQCYQHAALTLVHHAHRTNLKALTDEICVFYKDRFIKGELVDMEHTTSSGAKILKQVKIIQVIPPPSVSTTAANSLGSPVRVSVITTSPNKVIGNGTTTPSPLPPHANKSSTSPHSHSENPLEGIPNGLPHSSTSPDSVNPSDPTTPTKAMEAKTKTPRTPKSSITPEANLDPANYKYVVEYMNGSEPRTTAKASVLSRPKGALVPTRLKVFLRNATVRLSDRHPFTVKDEYVEKFGLGPSSIVVKPLPKTYLTSPFAKGRKRSLSQSKLDSFLSPGDTPPGKFSLSDSFLLMPSVKKRRPSSITKKKIARRSSKSSKTPSGKKKKDRRSSKATKTPKSPQIKTPKSPLIKQTPISKISKSLSTPSSLLKSPQAKAEAQKALNKAKKFKQRDLKKSVVKRSSLDPIELAELRLKEEFERQRRAALMEEEKARRKEQRLRRLREQQEKRRQAKIMQREWLKPREDMLCEDNKKLPVAAPVKSSVPPELFGGAVMILEFLNTFGPLFDIKEVIRGGITFEAIEYAITTQEMDSLLFEIIKFLLQAIFAVMEEEHENHMISPKKSSSKASRSSPETAPTETTGAEGTGKKSKESTPIVEMNGNDTPPPPPNQSPPNKEAEPKEGDNDIVMEEAPPSIADDEIDDEKPLDLQVQTIKTAAVGFSQWPFLTQHLSLHEVVIDAYTVTEVLRLHFLSCGGFKDTGERSWFRHARRGGFTDTDDPSMDLRRLRPDIINALGRCPIYSFSPADKLEVLSILCSQLLTYSVAREFMEEAAGRAKKARRLIKEVQLAEEKRKKEEVRLKKEEAKLKKQQEEEEGAEKGKENKGNGVGGGEREKGNGVGGSGESSDPVVIENEAEPTTKEPTLAPYKEPAPAPNKELTPAVTRAEASKKALAEEKRKQDGEDEEERKARIEEEIAQHQEELREASASINLQPIGLDRYYRKYILFPSVAGLFVEDSGEFPLPDSKHPSNSTSANAGQPQSSDMETTPQAPPTTASSSETNPAGEGVADSNKTQLGWSCYSSLEEIEKLQESLNPRGIREGELRKKLEHLKSHFEGSLKDCVLTGQRVVPSSKPKYNSASAFFELYLREQILDIEEKIHIGNLGYISDRIQWRDSIQNSGAAASIPSPEESRSATPAPPSSSSPPPPPSMPPQPRVGEESGEEVVRELANALLQVQAGIGKKFLMPPLGMAVDQKKRKLRGKKVEEVKEKDVCVEQWRASLGQATSFSQIFLHLATLERAVMWSKSLMNVRCRICRRKCGDEFMLLCDGCDHGYHTYCLKPPLKDVPDGDWFCYDCNPVTPVKPRRRVQRVLIVEESSESEEEEEEEEGVESEAESEAGLQGSNDEAESEDQASEDEAPSMQTRSSGRGGRGSSRGGRGRGRGRGRGKRVAQVRRSKLEEEEEEEDEVPPPAKRGRGKNSQAQTESKKQNSNKKEAPRARKKLRLDDPPSVQTTKAESIIASIIDLRCSHGKRQLTGAGKRELKALEMQLCQALWEEVSQHQDSWHFATPVKKKECPDYLDFISEPMDLQTIKSRIKCGHYSSIDDFLQDVYLIFSNCVRYNRRQSKVYKAATGLKGYFEKRCNDLGLKDLRLSHLDTSEEKGSGARGNRRSKRHK